MAETNSGKDTSGGSEFRCRDRGKGQPVVLRPGGPLRPDAREDPLVFLGAHGHGRSTHTHRGRRRLDLPWSLAMVALCLTACAAPLERPAVVSPAVAAEIVVPHPSAAVSLPHTLTLDDQAIAVLAGGIITRFAVQPGAHWLGVGCAVAWGLDWTEHHLTLLADPRTTYYFLVRPREHCVRLEAVTETAARELLERPTSPALTRASPQ